MTFDGYRSLARVMAAASGDPLRFSAAFDAALGDRMASALVGKLAARADADRSPRAL